MATLILFKKGLYMMLFMGALPVFAQITQITFGYLPVIVAVLFMLIIVSPEIAVLLFKDFRLWVKSALEDGDGRFDKADLLDTFLLYGAILPVRAVAFGYLFQMIGGWNPTYEQLYGPLLATVAAGGMSYLNKKK